MDGTTPELTGAEQRDRYRQFLQVLARHALDDLTRDQVYAAQIISCRAPDDGRHDRALELIADEYTRRRADGRYQQVIAAAVGG